MGVYTSPIQLQRAQARKFARMELLQKNVHKELLSESQKDYAIGSGGGVSTKSLRAMGHPFAREGSAARGIVKNRGKFQTAGKTYRTTFTKKGGQVGTKNLAQVRRGIIQPLPINKQTGKLRSSFKRYGTFETTFMGFFAPYAKYVLSPTGTKKMIARGFYSKRAGSIQDLGWLAKRHRARAQAAIVALRNQQRGLN